mmetsp:Transcript_57524/g.130337  ORF Transcript_57524/g.130337 Transcript_57524/m.130337 type:complete len:204 (-) Transcript_57524:37-648(-)
MLRQILRLAGFLRRSQTLKCDAHRSLQRLDLFPEDFVVDHPSEGRPVDRLDGVPHRDQILEVPVDHFAHHDGAAVHSRIDAEAERLLGKGELVQVAPQIRKWGFPVEASNEFHELRESHRVLIRVPLADFHDLRGAGSETTDFRNRIPQLEGVQIPTAIQIVSSEDFGQSRFTRRAQFGIPQCLNAFLCQPYLFRASECSLNA